MGKKNLNELLDEAAADAEAGRGQDAGELPAHVTVSRPGHARSRVLQVRLNPEEYHALEQLAQERGVPVSTIARAHLLSLLGERNEADPLQRLMAAARDFALG